MKNQLEIKLDEGRHGGRRRNAGRTRKHSKGVAHTSRERVTIHTPFHINFKYTCFIRTNRILEILYIALLNSNKKGLFVTHFSLQSNHVHLIGEAESTQVLITGMRSLTNTMVKRIGKGSIQLERYHLHVLKTPREVKHAVNYVLNNDLKHQTLHELKFTQIVAEGKSWLLRNSISS